MSQMSGQRVLGPLTFDVSDETRVVMVLDPQDSKLPRRTVAPGVLPKQPPRCRWRLAEAWAAGSTESTSFVAC